MKQNQAQRLSPLKPTHLTAHQKQSFRLFLIQKIQEAFMFVNFLTREMTTSFNIIFLHEYVYLKEITYVEFAHTMTYGYYVYIPVYIFFKNEMGHEEKQFEWFCCGLLPGMTQNSSFIINGITRSVFTQIIRKQGLFFHPVKKKSLKQKEISTLLELRVKKFHNYSTRFLFYRYHNGESWILFKKYRLQIPAALFLKALDISTSSISHLLFQNERLLHLDNAQYFYLQNLPLTKLEARFIIYKIFLNVLEEIEYELVAPTKKNFNDLKQLDSFEFQTEMNFLKETKPEYQEKSEDFFIHEIKKANFFFLIFFWNDLLRECNKALRLQLIEQYKSPFSLDVLELQAFDFFCIFQKLYTHQEELVDIDHLLNKEIRTCGDFLYMHTLEGLFRFLNEIETKIKAEKEYEQYQIQQIQFNEYEDLFSKALPFEKENIPFKLLFSGRFTYFISLEWKSFFISGTLSQYGQNLNPLSFLTHSRRLTSLGHEGLTRENASVDVRNIHVTSFGHFCPVETPEGKNVGLVYSMALFTWCHHKKNLNQQKLSQNQKMLLTPTEIFAEFATPFFYVYKQQVQKDHPLLVTLQGQEYYFLKGSLISADISSNKWFFLDHYGIDQILEIPNFTYSWSFENEYMHQTSLQYISPYQIISAVTGLIPFIEHNDANRALMGSNMQRQAVNLLNASISKIKTGLEIRTLSDINYNLYSPYTGLFSQKTETGFSLYTKNLNKNHILYNLSKKTNEYTYSYGIFDMLLRNWVQKGDFCGDYGSSKKGKLALGQNLFVGYLPWYGWNFEDAIILNEKCISLFTGLHYTTIILDPVKESSIELDIFKRKQFIQSSNRPEIDMEDQDQDINKNGIFFEIPIHPLKLFSFLQNSRLQDLLGDFSDYSFKKELCPHLMKINLEPGMHIKTGNCLYGKCTIFLSYTRSLLLQYFDLQEILSDIFPTFLEFKDYVYSFLFFEEYFLFNKSNNLDKVMNSSLKSREFIEGDLKKSSIDSQKVNSMWYIVYAIVYEEDFIHFNIDVEENENISLDVVQEKICLFNAKQKQTFYNITDTSIYAQDEHEGLIISMKEEMISVNLTLETEIDFESLSDENLEEIHELEKTIENGLLLKQLQLEIVQKKELEIGDKLSGRHGNKGILSKICANENMPYLFNGKPLDIVLNPLGIPSRMNLGQLYECFLGLGGHFLNESYTLSIFDEKYGVDSSKNYADAKLFASSLQYQNDWLYIPNNPGKTYLFNGITGECFEQPISIGLTTIIKLIHMVDKKLYARTQGAYSALSKQPVQGRSLLGGQRLGEMEIWALQGYGAAFTIQEIYSLKSGYLHNRNKIPFLFEIAFDYKKEDFFAIESFLYNESKQNSPLFIEFRALLLHM